jgi:hypothetical protein
MLGEIFDCTGYGYCESHRGRSIPSYSNTKIRLSRQSVGCCASKSQGPRVLNRGQNNGEWALVSARDAPLLQVFAERMRSSIEEGQNFGFNRPTASC